MTRVCRHVWDELAVMYRAEVDEADPIAHTSFVVFGGWTCRGADVFPRVNYALTTPRFRQALNDQLRAQGWHLDWRMEE